MDFLWDGVGGDLQRGNKGHFLNCQIKVAVTKSETLILHKSINEVNTGGGVQ